MTIQDPSPGAPITVQLEPDSGAGRFSVRGTTSGVLSESAKSGFIPKAYVLVHPEAARQWWVQPAATIAQDGTWFATGWYGSKEFPPKAGEKISIVVIVGNPKDVEQAGGVFGDPREARPLAQSDIISLSVGSILPE